MDTFLASQTFFILAAGAVALLCVALPIVLIAFADSEQRANRKRFATGVLIVFSATIARALIDLRDEPVLDVLAFILWLGAYAWLGRLTAERLNDVGRSRRWAFLLLAPYANVVLVLILLFMRPRSADRRSAVAA